MKLIDLTSISGNTDFNFFHRISDTSKLEDYTIKESLYFNERAKAHDLVALLFEQGVLAIDSFTFDQNFEKATKFISDIQEESIVKVYVVNPDLLSDYIKSRVTNLTSGFSELSDSEASKQFNLLAFKAHSLGAQDIYIHLSSSEDTAFATFKVDGELLQEPYPLKNYAFGRSICASIYDGKVGTGMQRGSFDDVTTPQERSIRHIITDDAGNTVGAYEYRFTKTVTRGTGEILINMRAQGKARQLSELGIQTDVLSELKQGVREISSTGGMSIICGQTGSGKSTTNYGLLLGLPRTCCVQTFEDPIEVTKPREYTNITQNSLNPKAGVDVQLASIMRQAPDCLFLQEIRDAATAKFAVGISLTGHGCVTSIHAPNPFAIIQRLEGLGVDRSSLADSGMIKLLSSQVLVKKLCPHCALPISKLDKNERDAIEPHLRSIKCKTNKNIRFRNKQGCDKCNSGESGRLPILELIHLTDEDRKYILSGDNLGWKKYRKSQGHKAISDYALELFKAGVICFSRLQELTND